ncbi:hypothetical protein PoB_000325000 [Plakobranchus ocellatus]|uniref:Uncharacterized protein n=1 Tax=Plakobranchus ocellatus TaxID=259542 RepID=A0AAV3Y0Z9_9GAST|nr:hypothetical protein PoB_000325000 [Plakobranchus ocellatus]
MLFQCWRTRAVAENRGETACQFLQFTSLFQTCHRRASNLSLSPCYPSHRDLVRFYSHNRHSRYPHPPPRQLDSLPAPRNQNRCLITSCVPPGVFLQQVDVEGILLPFHVDAVIIRTNSCQNVKQSFPLMGSLFDLVGRRIDTSSSTQNFLCVAIRSEYCACFVWAFFFFSSSWAIFGVSSSHSHRLKTCS